MMKIVKIVVFMFLIFAVGCQSAGIDVVETIEKHQTTITVAAIGDVLLHERAYVPAQVTVGTYDFMPMLERVKTLLSAPSFLMANIESIPGGVEIGLSTYPSFNSPKEIVTDLQSLGVDMVIGANNHTLDRGLRAVESALNFYDEIGMPYVGNYRNFDDRDTARIVTVEDISIGVLAYTYGLNGIAVPKGHEYVVGLINPDQMVADIEKIRKKVDVLVVHMHWGAEYELEPNQGQRDLAMLLAESGVDIVFGHHPHVLQPIERIKLEEGHETIVFYSLGNFLSGQNFDYTDIGGVGTVAVTKTVEGEDVSVKVDAPNIEPTIVVQKDNGYFVWPMEEAEVLSISGATLEEIMIHTQSYLVGN
ncbi:CapA family protein [Bacillaceae bacterium IKA-2]|nr:CapA family protein [Bacillaceae bacterium IKA-2]